MARVGLKLDRGPRPLLLYRLFRVRDAWAVGRGPWHCVARGMRAWIARDRPGIDGRLCNATWIGGNSRIDAGSGHCALQHGARLPRPDR